MKRSSSFRHDDVELFVSTCLRTGEVVIYRNVETLGWRVHLRMELVRKAGEEAPMQKNKCKKVEHMVEENNMISIHVIMETMNAPTILINWSSNGKYNLIKNQNRLEEFI